MNTTLRQSSRSERGAALIVAIGILTLLIVIALTFFRASLGDVRTAENTVNGVRAELMADGATAVAIAFLNHDRDVHPSYSSLDHAWRSYFNGTWAMGKAYLWAPLADPQLDPSDQDYIHRMSPLRGGIPEVDLTLYSAPPNRVGGRWPNDNLYIPRADIPVNPSFGSGGFVPWWAPQVYATLDGNGALQNPFVTTADLAVPGDPRRFPPLEALFTRLANTPFNHTYFLADLAAMNTVVFDDIAPNGRALSLRSASPDSATLPYEQIHFWTDVDNDGDGLRDSMWLPIPADRYFPDDGLDNDLDGFRDALGADGLEDSGDEDTDGEPGVFLYRGDTDGIDNDGDGVVDNDEEYFIVIFTVPVPFLSATDVNNNQIMDDPVTPTAQELANMGITNADTVLFEGDPNSQIGFDRFLNPIRTRDNDYDLVIDQPMDASNYMLTGLATDALLNANTAYPYYNLLLQIVGQSNINAYLSNAAGGPLPIGGAIRGENVTEIAGRMAILIKDEASKVNVNAAGGWAYPVIPDPLSPPSDGPLLGIDTDPAVEPSTATTPLQRAFADGVGPHEFELRVIPQFSFNGGIGAPRARWMWQYLMGAREGFFAQALPANDPFDLGYHTFEREPDATLPGYGFVDDNANLLQLALDGINNHGGPFYLTDGNNPNDAIDPRIDRGLLGQKWEGIDEPAEYQRFRPLRNLVSETNGNLDDDGDDIANEIGELGDQFYRTHQQLKLINAGTFGGNLGVRGLNRQEIFDELSGLVTAHSSDRNERHQHQDFLLNNYELALFRHTTGLKKDLNVARPQQVARAVKREWSYPASAAERRVVLGSGALGDRIEFLDDTDFGEPGTLAFLRGLRQENMTVTTSQEIMGLLDTSAESIAFAMPADAELRAHQVATSLKDFADRDLTSSVDDEIYVADTWWRTLAAPFIGDPDPVLNAAAQLAQTRRIYYTTAGIEAIRINEVNVRPVRRFEAEATTLTTAADFDRGLNPNRFVPQNLGLTPEEIEGQGFRVRRTTTLDAIDAYNQERNPNSDIVVENVDATNAWALEPGLNGLLGLEAAWATYRRYLDVTDPDTERQFRVPDVVQFSFQATDGLPAGRYYLTVNTRYVDDTGVLQPSVGRESDFLFAVKIGTLEQDWFTDVMNIEAYAAGGSVYNEAWRAPALLGDDRTLGGSGGMAFLQGDAVFRSLVPIGNDPFAFNRQQFLNNNSLDRNLGFTIEVPAGDGDPNTVIDDPWIHVAIRSLRPDGVGFVVNYLDFSQEPDHEWVEVTNISDREIDLSGWELAVHNHPLGIGPMTVPAGTIIAPKGYLLLGTNKFDYAFNIDPLTGNPVIPGDGSNAADPDLFDRGTGFFSNGVGLISADDIGPGAGAFFGITVPQTMFDPLDPDQGSVFYRPGAGPIDYLDLDGDGAVDPFPPAGFHPDDVVTTTVDPVLISGAIPQSSTKPWDRIVELIVPDLVAQSPQSDFTAADVGRIVLAGGIFPNRPEFDFVDNDGDNRIVGSDGIDNDGDNGLLVADGIDNDGDGLVDEALEGVDEPFEGVDEGRILREGRLAASALGLGAFPVPGAYHAVISPYTSLFFDFDPADLTTIPAYWDGGIEPNPPQWKEFIERRNFPGDNVVVTLFEGPASDNQVADRVTYTQRDVDNRQIDDVLFVNDFDTVTAGVAFADEPLTNAGIPVPLDDRFPSFWPENTMGVDFARSLERKHPLYTGDRFGTRNRFQATDGSYDDWSDSAGRWERRYNFGGGVVQNVTMLDRLGDPLLTPPEVFQAFAHAQGGTPLRRNVAARYAEESLQQGFQVDHEAIFSLASVRNGPMVSPGDAVMMPHTSKRTQFLLVENALTAEGPFMLDLASPNANFATNGAPPLPFGHADLTYESALVGQEFDDAASPIEFFQDLRSFIGDAGTTDSVSLNAGQATVIQVLRGGVGADVTPDEPWPTVGGVVTGTPPQRWSPLMTFELAGTLSGADDASIGLVPPYDYERQYLFQPLASLPATVDNARWPMPLRTALYASSNFDNFNSVNPAAEPLDGAQAVFVWDGDDGLENGEYDLYVVATEDLSLLAQADAEMILDDPNDPFDPFDSRLLTDTGNLFGGNAGVGAPFVAASGRTANREVFVDVEVFRDSNGDRTAWTNNDGDDFIEDNNIVGGEFLHRGQDVSGDGIPDVPFESFGLLVGAQPDADGMIHYGVVRVQNNFLAVSLRNRSAPGVVARFSRVILAARNKTPGRLNINTVESRRIDDGNLADSFYNPLVGLPGVLQMPAPPNRDFDSIGPANMFTDPAGFDLTDDESSEDQMAVVLARRIMEQRLRLVGERPDGRYYEVTSDLMSDAHFEPLPDNPATLGSTDPALRPPLVVEYGNILPDGDQNFVVDARANRAGAIAEAAYRFRKMQNLITPKGEVFEILVTVQAGYGTDANGDGRINWRDDTEFTVTAEKTARTIYER